MSSDELEVRATIEQWRELVRESKRKDALIGAQVAVIERVRALAEEWETSDDDADLDLIAGELLDALAAAPEHAAPEKLGQDALERLAAANARVAELEADVCERETHRDLAEAARDAANDRADAAETDLQITVNQRDRAESEAAALRVKLLDREAKFVDKHAEVVALRAELDKVNAKYADARDRCIAAQDSLSTATELLRQGLRFVPPTNGVQERWGDAVRALLPTAPAPTEREASERKVFTTVQGQTLSTCSMADLEVLKELDSVPTNVLRRWLSKGTVPQANVAKAELARRAVKG